jgi:hypothetical protein
LAEDGVVGMSLDVFLEVLGSLEGLAAVFAAVRLQRHVDANVRRDVISLDSGGTALVPLAGETEVVGALATDMALAEMLI